MTFRQFFVKKLVDEYLMFPQDANAVMDAVEAAPVNEPMQGRWNDETTDYPPFLLNITWINVKDSAIAWTKTNLPQAFFLPLLIGEQE